MQKYLKEQKYQGPSLALRPITDQSPHQFNCECLMCNSFIDKKEMQILAEKEEKMLREKNRGEVDRYPESNMQTILKGLMLPSNKIVKRGVQIFIPQICFFQQGEPTSLFYHKIGKDIVDSVDKTVADEYTLIKMKKEKITTTCLQKIFNEHRRIYRDRIKKVLKLNLVKEKSIRKGGNRNNNIKFSRGDNLQAAIVKYTDGCQSMYSESELLFLLQKRKYDPFWKKIVSIKTFVGPLSDHAGDTEYVNVDFNLDKPSHPALWERAKKLMLTYSGKVVPFDRGVYISDEEESTFCGELKKESKQCFGIYTFYKVAAYYAQFSDERITKAQAKLFINEFGQCFLLDIIKMQSKPLLKYNFTNQICQEMMKNEQYNKYHKKELHPTQKTEKYSSVIEGLMQNQYEELKNRYGVTSQPKVDENQRKNDDFFKFMYPGMPANMSELIKEKIPLRSFKKKYMGIEEKRRPLFKQFNSKFVRELHRLTPRTTKADSMWSVTKVTKYTEKGSGRGMTPQTARSEITTWKTIANNQNNKMNQTISS